MASNVQGREGMVPTAGKMVRLDPNGKSNSSYKQSSKTPRPFLGPPTMNTDRRLKKRESDRRCQRVSRERTKSRLAYLENLVEQVKEADASGQMGMLLERISQLQQERDAMATKLKAIESILLPPTENTGGNVSRGESNVVPAPTVEIIPARSGPLSFNDDSVTVSGTLHQSSTYKDSIVSPEVSTVPEEDMEANGIFAASQDTRSVDDLHSPAASAQPYLGNPQPTHHAWNGSNVRGTTCECGYAMSLKKQELNFWYQGNLTLGAWMKWPNLVPPFLESDLYQDDTPVRAVIEGWDAVERRGNVHPMWRLVRTIDESLFTHAESPVNRLGILYNVSRVLRAHIDPTHTLYTKLPQFFLERHNSHDHYAYATNFVAWPAIRRALVEHEHRYCRNHFWRTFINCMRAAWPFEFRDCYHYNPTDGYYKITPSFVDMLGDIRRIGVTKNFYDSFPEFRGAVMTLDEVPPSIGTNREAPSFPNGFSSLDYFRQRPPASQQREKERMTDEDEAMPRTLDGMIASLFNISSSEGMQMQTWIGHDPVVDASYVSARDFL